jgi:phospholipid/cholesterol/gamma-HCH transport system substrate-binding protein
VPRRVRTNLIAIAVVSVALLLYAGSQLLASALLDRSYPLFIELPRAAGLGENKGVTYNGHPIGEVAETELSGERVRVRMKIDDGEQVPRATDVVVLRRSSIGEQAVDFRPFGPETENTEYYQEGDTVTPRNLTLPPQVNEFLNTANKVLAPVDEEEAGILVGELADTFRGRVSDVRGLLRDSADFSEAVADNGQDYDRLFDASRVVNSELADSRATLRRLIPQLRQSASILTDMRTEFEQLLVEAPPTLTLFGDLVERSQANLSCAIRDFANFTEFNAEPDNLFNQSEALRLNRFFFEGAEAQQAEGPTNNWFRVLFLPPQNPPAQKYIPDRPIPNILPGGACESPFGPGAGAATQDGYSPLLPDDTPPIATTSGVKVIPPENGRPGDVERATGSTFTGAEPPAPDEEDGTRIAAAGDAGDTLPATGGGAALPLVVGGGLLVLAARSLTRTVRSSRRG